MKTFSEWYAEAYPYANSPTQSKMLYEVWAYQQDIIDKLAEVIRMLDYVHNGHPPKALYGKGGIEIIDGARKLLTKSNVPTVQASENE